MFEIFFYMIQPTIWHAVDELDTGKRKANHVIDGKFETLVALWWLARTGSGMCTSADQSIRWFLSFPW
jgi:hypothetical protein